eukprot:s3200_g5.t1
MQALIQIILPGPDGKIKEIHATLKRGPDDVKPDWPEIETQLEEVKQEHQKPDYVFRYLVPNDNEKKLYDLNSDENFEDLVLTYHENKKPESEPPLVLPLVLAAPDETMWNPEKEPKDWVLMTKNTFLEFGQMQKLQDILKKNVTSHI